MKQVLTFAFLCVAMQFQAQLTTSDKGNFIDSDRAKIYYETYGEGTPLILLHGFGRTLEDWQSFIAEFSKTYRVIAWDMRGHADPVILDPVRFSCMRMPQKISFLYWMPWI